MRPHPGLRFARPTLPAKGEGDVGIAHDFPIQISNSAHRNAAPRADGAGWALAHPRKFRGEMERRQAQHGCRRSIVRRLRRRQTKERIALRRSIDAACGRSEEAANRSARILATAKAAANIRCGVLWRRDRTSGWEGERPLIRTAFAAFIPTTVQPRTAELRSEPGR